MVINSGFMYLYYYLSNSYLFPNFPDKNFYRYIYGMSKEKIKFKHTVHIQSKNI